MAAGAPPAFAPEYIRRIRPYLPGKPPEVLAAELGLGELCQLASNENTSGPAHSVREALQGAARLELYPDSGAYHLRQRLAAELGVPAEQLIFGNGSGELIDLVCRALLADGERVVMSRLGFVQYRLSAMASNAELVEVEPAAGTLADDVDGFIAAARGAKAVFLANPNNPTGTYWRRSELERYFAAVGPDVLTVIDQAYQEYVVETDYPQGLDDVARGRPVLVLGTFSKIHGLAGLRIGYGIGPRELLFDLERARLPFNTNVLAQVAALAALADRAHVAAARERNLRERTFLAAELTRRGFALTASVANFVCGLAPSGREGLAAALEQRGVLIRDLKGWGLPGGVRITVGTRAETERLLAALDAIFGRA